MNVSNHLQLIGQIEAPPIYLTTEAGMDLTIFYLLTQRSESPAHPATTDRHRCIAWGSVACSLHEHLLSGSRVAISGELCYRSMPQQQGNQHVIAEVQVRAFSFLGKGDLHLSHRRRALEEGVHRQRLVN